MRQAEHIWADLKEEFHKGDPCSDVNIRCRDEKDLIYLAMEMYADQFKPQKNLVEIDNLWFPVGVKLTSLENGQFIIAGPGTPDELVVGVVEATGLNLKRK